MIHYTGAVDPLHDRPPVATAETLRHNVESLHGSLLRLERTAPDKQAARAFHAAVSLVADLLWPVTA